MILEILDKLNLSIKLIRSDDSFGVLLNFLPLIDLIINEQSFSISTWTSFRPFLRPVLTFRGLCFRGSAFSRSAVCGLRVTLILDCKTVVFGRLRKARSAVSVFLECEARKPRGRVRL